MTVKRVVNSVFSSNTYLLGHEGSLAYWLVDIGDTDQVLALLPKGGQVKGVFVTHSHFDHIYGINELVDAFPHCSVYVSSHGKEGLYSDKLNFSRYHGTPLVFGGDHVQVLQEGSRVSLWPGIDMDVYETPGHDWSCLTYRSGKFVFSGDSYLPGIDVFARFPKSDKAAAAESEKKILSLAQGCVVYPGHGNIVVEPA